MESSNTWISPTILSLSKNGGMKWYEHMEDGRINRGFTILFLFQNKDFSQDPSSKGPLEVSVNAMAMTWTRENPPGTDEDSTTWKAVSSSVPSVVRNVSRESLCSDFPGGSDCSWLISYCFWFLRAVRDFPCCCFLTNRPSARPSKSRLISHPYTWTP